MNKKEIVSHALDAYSFLMNMNTSITLADFADMIQSYSQSFRSRYISSYLRSYVIGTVSNKFGRIRAEFH